MAEVCVRINGADLLLHACGRDIALAVRLACDVRGVFRCPVWIEDYWHPAAKSRIALRARLDAARAEADLSSGQPTDRTDSGGRVA